MCRIEYVPENLSLSATEGGIKKMRVRNRMTSSMHLIETIPVRGALDLLKRTSSASDGFSLEVFRGERHLTSIMSNSMERRWDLGVLIKGNTILKVNLGYRMMALSGQLYTQDNFTREYEIEMQIHVSNPTLFAMQYIQESDPIFLAQKEMERLLETYTQQARHNDLSGPQMRDLARRTLSSATHQRCGVAVDEVNRFLLKLDPRYA
jgi:hypothetical protein